MDRLLGASSSRCSAVRLRRGRSRRTRREARMPVVGYLGPGSAVSDAFRVTAFRQGLSEAGFVEGQNVTVDYRWAEEHYDRLPDVTVAMVAPLGPHSSASTRACFEFARPRGLTAASRLRTDLGCRPRLDGAQVCAWTCKTPLKSVGATGRRHHPNPAEAHRRWRGERSKPVRLGVRDHHTRSL